MDEQEPVAGVCDPRPGPFMLSPGSMLPRGLGALVKRSDLIAARRSPRSSPGQAGAHGPDSLAWRGSMMFTPSVILALTIMVGQGPPAQSLTPEEKAAGWILLFDGKTLDGWKTSSEKPSKVPVEQGAINPHGCGGYMMIHEKTWSDFVLALDFKISKGCNSGIFVRTFPLKPRPGKDVGFNGIEIAIDDTTTAGYHDTGAIYDLVKPRKNAMKPVGEWNHIVITCDRNAHPRGAQRRDRHADGPRRVDRPPTAGPTARSTSSTSPTRTIPARATSACRTTGRPAGSRTSRSGRSGTDRPGEPMTERGTCFPTCLSRLVVIRPRHEDCEGRLGNLPYGGPRSRPSPAMRCENRSLASIARGPRPFGLAAGRSSSRPTSTHRCLRRLFRRSRGDEATARHPRVRPVLSAVTRVPRPSSRVSCDRLNESANLSESLRGPRR